MARYNTKFAETMRQSAKTGAGTSAVKKANYIMRQHETKATLMPTLDDQLAAAGSLTATIHPTPKRSVTMPKLEEKNVLASGMVTVPPSESAA